MSDEKFWEDNMNAEGNEFTKFYYETQEGNEISYFCEDYVGLLGETVNSIYEIENTWDNYEKLRPLIDKRYREWKSEK